MTTYAMTYEVTVYVEQDNGPDSEQIEEVNSTIWSTLYGRAHDQHGFPVDLGCPNILSLGPRKIVQT